MINRQYLRADKPQENLQKCYSKQGPEDVKVLERNHKVWFVKRLRPYVMRHSRATWCLRVIERDSPDPSMPSSYGKGYLNSHNSFFLTLLLFLSCRPQKTQMLSLTSPAQQAYSLSSLRANKFPFPGFFSLPLKCFLVTPERAPNNV